MAEKNIHLVFGSDDGSVAEEALKLFNKLKPAEGDDFANDIIDGNADNADHAYDIVGETIQALQTLPFFGGKKVVMLKRATFLGTDRTSEAEYTIAGVEKLQELLEQGLGDDVIFIISATNVNKTRRFFKFLKKAANVIEKNKLDTSKDGWEEEVAKIVLKRAKSHDLSFDQDALDLFVTLAGEDTRQINCELEKLDLYLGRERRQVSLADVRRMVPLSRAGVIFEIGSAIQKGDGVRALELIDQQLDRGESPIALIRAALIPTVRNLFMAKAVCEMFPNQQLNRFNLPKVLGGLPASDLQWLPQKKAGGVNTWGLSFAIQPCKAYPMSALRHAMESILEADLTLVTSQLDHRMVLHRFVVELISSRTSKRRAS